MNNKNIYCNAFIGIPQTGTRSEYLNNTIYETIDEIKEFYDFLADNDNSVTIAVAEGPTNFNHDIFWSLSNTLDSLKLLLGLGRINDAFSLIRKYNDAVIIHIYVLIASEKEEQVFFEENHSLYDNIVNEWINGKKHLIEKEDYKSKEESFLSEIKNRDTTLSRLLFNKKIRKEYGAKRNIGNDNVHYNNWNTFRFNNDSIMDYPISLALLLDAHETISMLFVIHFAYLILLKPVAMLSSEYTDALDIGLQPNEETMNQAAPIVCEMFEKYIDVFDKKLANYLSGCTYLELR